MSITLIVVIALAVVINAALGLWLTSDDEENP